MAFFVVFSTKSTSTYERIASFLGPVFLHETKRIRTIQSNPFNQSGSRPTDSARTHRKSPKPRIPPGPKTNDLHTPPPVRRAVDPLPDQLIQRLRAQIRPYIDERRAGLLGVRARDERGDEGVGEVRLAHGGKAREGGVGVGEANGGIGVWGRACACPVCLRCLCGAGLRLAFSRAERG